MHAAAAAGLDVIDVPYLDLEDEEGMIVAARQAKSLGFCGKGSIHPKQIAALNEVFTPSPEEICLLYTSPRPRDAPLARLPSSA